MAVITISRQFGAGGITLGKMVAEKLGYAFADTERITSYNVCYTKLLRGLSS